MQDKLKWTPGPWAVQATAGHDRHGQSVVYAEADGKDIAIVYAGEANAALIAAAPEMYAALDVLVRAYFGGTAAVTVQEQNGAANMGRAALATARGEKC